MGKEKKVEKKQEKPVFDREKTSKEKELENWIPKTDTGKKVLKGDVSSLKQIFDQNLPILEPKIIDYLVPDLMEKAVDFKKTTKVKRSGRKFAFRAAVLVGDGKEFIGLGVSKDKEKWPAIRKATKKAKLNMIRIRKGCGSWECTCGEPHTVPFKVSGKSASVRINILPAPKGVGLVVGDNIKDVLKFVGIKDVWSETKGSTGTKLNFVSAAIDALSKTTKMKISKDVEKKIEKSEKNVGSG